MASITRPTTEKKARTRAAKDLPDPEPQEVTVEEETPAPEETEVEEQEIDTSEFEEPLEPLNLEDLDPNEKLWADGPTIAEVLELKSQYGEVFVTTILMDRHFLWKTLDRGEWREVSKRMEEIAANGEMTPAEATMYQEELVTEMCLLFPSMTIADFDKELAGLPSLLHQQILESSGFVANDTRGL